MKAIHIKDILIGNSHYHIITQFTLLLPVCFLCLLSIYLLILKAQSHLIYHLTIQII